MTDTKGNGIINTIFNGYAPYRGEIAYRKLGSLIAFESGESVTYGLFSAQDRGTLFIGPGEKVYAGMVSGTCQERSGILILVDFHRIALLLQHIIVIVIMVESVDLRLEASLFQFRA